MSGPKRILLLAGSMEAWRIATALAHSGMELHACLSEPPRAPEPIPVPTDLLSIVTVEALSALMADVDAVIDASHGFDSALSRCGYEAASEAGVPILALSRPPWYLEDGWRLAASVADAMPMVPSAARVFSATGWESLQQLDGFPGERLFLRQTTRHTRPVAHAFVELAFGEPPFSVADEIALFERLRIDTLICRNLGGAASRPKLDAAKALDLNVILVERPPLPTGLRVVHAVQDILDWAKAI